MEETEISTDFLMACALHPDTWFRWVPEEIVERVPKLIENLPLDKRVSISCMPNGIWVIADSEHNVLFSTSPVKILKDEKPAERLNIFKMLFAAISKSEPDPQEPPPKKTA